ncbi:glutaminase [Sphaerochaeta sp.]|uniref:glutaminase n=1 Tax=Sphaerochaeta sp. TaxID=1972642 RepID=UPI003D0E07A7
MYFDEILQQIQDDMIPHFGKGKVVDYIPALRNMDPKGFGICVQTVDGQMSGAGSWEKKFSIQSISKVFSLTMALSIAGEDIWKNFSKSSSNAPFNAITPLEASCGIPTNPFVNAGAILVADMLISITEDAKTAILDFVRELSGNDSIQYDFAVAGSEKSTGYRNVALANLMKSYGVLKNSVDEVLDVYFHQCSLAMSCKDVAKATLYLANHGYCPEKGRQVIANSQTRRINALLMTCGMYESSSEFAFNIGLPGKSGVGGGIFVTVPHNLSVCIWSPELDEHGNSYVGTKALEDFIEKTDLSVF